MLSIAMPSLLKHLVLVLATLVVSNLIVSLYRIAFVRGAMSRSGVSKALTFVIFVLVVGCSESTENASESVLKTSADWAAELPAPEKFSWDDQPISFSPPPADWERQREQSGGLMGARFVKYVSGGQAIHVAEVTAIGRRDRCSELETLLQDLDELSPREFRSRLQRAQPYLNDPINRSEKTAFEAALGRLGDAKVAYRAGDLDETRSRISAALWDLRWVEYSLDEVVGPAMFTGKGYAQFGEVKLSETVAMEVAGEEALSLDFRIERGPNPDRVIYGRKVYVAHNNRLFEASFQGVEKYRPLFDAMVATISFPAGPCEH